METGNPRGALEQYRRAEKIRSELTAADPRDVRAASGLVSIEWRTAVALAEAGDRAASRQTFEKAAVHGEQLIETFPDKQIGRASLADVCSAYGRCWVEKWSSCEHARPWLERARDLFHQVGDESDSQEASRKLAGCRK
jgi:hypothetical protein